MLLDLVAAHMTLALVGLKARPQPRVVMCVCVCAGQCQFWLLVDSVLWLTSPFVFSQSNFSQKTGRSDDQIKRTLSCKLE